MAQEIFENTEIRLTELPSVDTLQWHPLERIYRRMLLLLAAFRCAVLVTVVVVIMPFVDIPAWIPLAVVCAILVVTLVQVLFIVQGFPYKGYAVRSRDVLYRTGWLFKRQIAIPLSRLQHIEVRQGILERLFGLSRINIYTAGGESSDLTIPGLPEQDAQRLKEYILRETTVSDEEH
jgi:uncharacterized protein